MKHCVKGCCLNPKFHMILKYINNSGFSGNFCYKHLEQQLDVTLWHDVKLIEVKLTVFE